MSKDTDTTLTTAIAALTTTQLDLGERITLLRAIIGAAEDAIAGEVAVARLDGWSWGQLAPALGTTRQAAQQRYGTS